MAAFSEPHWDRIDVHAIVECRGIATIDERRRPKCLDWLRRNGYEIDLLDCSRGLDHAVPNLGVMLKWQQQFGYTLTSNNWNLDALRDGFEFEVSADRGKVLEIVGADVAWRENARWLLGLLAIAEEASLRKLALGRRFFTLLVLPEQSPLFGQVIEASMVPAPFWSPCREIHEFKR